MEAEEAVGVVKGFFACVAQGDITGLQALLTDDVEWSVAGPTTVVPWAGTRRGPAQVAYLYTLRPETLDVEQLDLHAFVTQGETIVVLGQERARVKSTGRACEVGWATVFTLRGNKIAVYQEYSDTAAWAAAYSTPEE